MPRWRTHPGAAPPLPVSIRKQRHQNVIGASTPRACHCQRLYVGACVERGKGLLRCAEEIAARLWIRRRAQGGFSPGRLCARDLKCEVELLCQGDGIGKEGRRLWPLATSGQETCLKPLTLDQQQ